MTDLLEKIRRAQVEAGEQAVLDDLRARGLTVDAQVRPFTRANVIPAQSVPMKRRQYLYCSFCGKAQDEVFMLVAGPGMTFICDECVADAVRIITARKIEKATAPMLTPV